MSQPDDITCPGRCGKTLTAGIADYGRLWLWVCDECPLQVEEERTERP